MNYIVFHKDTGKILRTGSCPGHMLQNQVLNSDEDVMEGIADDIRNFVDPTTKKLQVHEQVEIQHTALLSSNLLINQRMNDILRRQAISELTAEGLIDKKE